MGHRLMTRGFIGGLILALLVLLAPDKQAHAQQGIVWTTGFQVQNLSDATATVTIELVNPDGTNAATISDISISSKSNKTYFPVPNVNTPFTGSAIIKSNQRIAAILNILGNNGVAGQPFYSGSASGVSEGSTDVMLPLILRNNNGTSTWFAVQNVGDAAATVTVKFTSAGAGNSYTTQAVTIQKGASYIFDQSTDTALGDKFVGSATVSSTQKLAVIVNQIGKNPNNLTMLTYSGFPSSSGSNSVALPVVMQANGGNGSGITVQNTGQTTANVTVTYSTNLVPNGAAMVPNTFSIAVGGSYTVLKLSTNPADKYVGSATITTGAADQTVVAIINQVGKGTGSSYEGMNTASATAQVSFPLLMTNNGTYTTVQCINLGQESTVSIAYNPNTVPGSTFSPTNESKLVKKDESVIFIQNFASKYVGGGIVTSNPASNIICIANQLKPNSGDSLLTYDGINF